MNDNFQYKSFHFRYVIHRPAPCLFIGNYIFKLPFMD